MRIIFLAFFFLFGCASNKVILSYNEPSLIKLQGKTVEVKKFRCHSETLSGLEQRIENKLIENGISVMRSSTEKERIVDVVTGRKETRLKPDIEIEGRCFSSIFPGKSPKEFSANSSGSFSYIEKTGNVLFSSTFKAQGFTYDGNPEVALGLAEDSSAKQITQALFPRVGIMTTEILPVFQNEKEQKELEKDFQNENFQIVKEKLKNRSDFESNYNLALISFKEKDFLEVKKLMNRFSDVRAKTLLELVTKTEFSLADQKK